MLRFFFFTHFNGPTPQLVHDFILFCVPAVSSVFPSFHDTPVASTVQTAAVLSVGLLYQGSGNRMMAEFLLKEAARR